MRKLLMVIAMIGASVVGNVPATAADARWIVFDSNRSGNADIWMIRSDGTGLRQLTTTSSADRSPAWSPDASKIAFVSNRDGDWEIYTMNLTGGAVTQLTHNSGTFPFWSPPVWSSTNKIAFVSNRDGRPDPVTKSRGRNELYTMNADGSNQTRITFSEEGEDNPAWSPDGSRLFFARTVPGIGFSFFSIFSMKPDGTDVVRLTNNNSCSYHSPSVSPDGTTVAFISECGSNLSGAAVALMDIDGTDVRFISPLAEIYDDWPTWSSDSSQITFASTSGGVYPLGMDIYVMNADGSDVTNLTNTLVDGDMHPVFAPN